MMWRQPGIRSTIVGLSYLETAINKHNRKCFPILFQVRNTLQEYINDRESPELLFKAE